MILWRVLAQDVREVEWEYGTDDDTTIKLEEFAKSSGTTCVQGEADYL